MKNVKISVKLIVLVVLLSGINAFVGLYGLENTTDINDGMTTMYKDRVIPLKQIITISNLYSENLFRITRDARENKLSYTSCMRQIDVALERINKNWNNYLATYMDSQEKILADEVEKLKSKADDALYELRNALSNKDSASFFDMRETFLNNSFVLLQKLNELSTLQVTVADKINTDSDNLYFSARRNTYFLISFCVIISLLLAFWIILNISKSLKKSILAINKVAEGDFSSKIENPGEDEIGKVLQLLNLMVDKLRSSVFLANRISKGDLTMISDLSKNTKNELDLALNQMVINLNNIIEKIYTGASSLASASNEISGASQQMSQGANEQASSSEEVTSSMEEMTASVQQNTENAKEAERISKKSAQEINESNRAVTKTLSAMKEIAERIKVINEIANKTDLLAVNAGIEAARAGENGKGFAVVSSEVRKLAENSRKAALEIDELISNSLGIAEKSALLLADLVPEIEKTSRLLQEIAASSVEQNGGINQVNVAMTQLNQVTQQNAAAAEELSTSSEELSGQASQLIEVIGFFKTENKPILQQHPVKKRNFHVARIKDSRHKTQEKGVTINLEDEITDKRDNEFEHY